MIIIPLELLVVTEILLGSIERSSVANFPVFVLKYYFKSMAGVVTNDPLSLRAASSKVK